MNQLWEILRESLPEIISGLVVAAILALVGIAARGRVIRAASSNQRTLFPSSSSHPGGLSLSPNAKPKSQSESEKEKAELLDLKCRRLHELKQALMGIGTPPEVLIEIEDLEEEVRGLEHERKPEPFPIRRAVELRTGTAGERRHFLVGPLSPEEARAVERWAGVCPIVAVASDFFQVLIQALQGAG